ncbi:alpha/beta-hydrolase [Penicillium angulare]|uniref:Alpha/beta-hydrolase n=1 Tax=Penicillium angulare TaxID=116970 RepID=A0A9W9FVC5_9EURO|nr:alpha/beta-hydrolase [Penicillium angulare]
MNRDHLEINPEPGLDIYEFTIPARDNHPICVRVYKQSTLKEDLPLLIYLHGGGFVTGGLETDDASCRALAREIPLLILNVEYRLAPENPFPVGFEDSFDVVRWAASHGTEKLPINLQRGFLLGGTSAGANFTMGIAHLAVQEKLSPSLTGLLFLAGSFCHPDARPAQYKDRILSVDEINDAPGLTRKSIDYFAAKYGAPPEDKRLSSLLFESHANLAPKAVFYVCGWDPRRDEALLFGELLEKEGVAVKSYVYPGLPHGFWTTCPDLEVSRAWERDLIEGVGLLLR